MEFVGHDKNRVIWEVVDDHVVEEPTDHKDIGLRGFDLNLFGDDEEGVVREGSSEFPYLLILINIWPGNWKTQLNRTNHKMDEENVKSLVKSNLRYQKVRRFSSNEFWKNIGCLVSAPTFGLGGSRLWDKEEDINIIGKKRKRLSILIRVYLYEVCLSGIIYFLLFYFKTILTPFFSRFLVSLSLGERSSESIGHKDLCWKRTREHMNGGGKCF